MTDDKFELSRRKILASAGAIGIAGAGAGLGTSAYFSDQETFTNNELIAGELDMKVGWEEHYSDWSDDENNGLSGDVAMESDRETGAAGSTVDSTRVGLPANAAALISTEDETDAETFLDNTLEGQYPPEYRAKDLPAHVDCDNRDGDDNILGDIDDDQDDEVILADDDREDAAPVISLGDVKPGDFGEVTFSFALCDNPGYVWAGAFLEDASENGITEPEAEDTDENEGEPRDPGADVPASEVELLDELQVAVWLDDGDNYQDCGEQPLTVGSLREVIDGTAPNITSGQNGLRLDGRNVDVAAEPNGKPEDIKFTSIGVNRFDYQEDGDYTVDFELVDDPADSGRGKVAHATSDGAKSGDYATSAVSVCESLDDIESLTYEYNAGSGHTGASPDEVWLLVQDTDDGSQSVIWRNESSGNLPSGWETRNVAAEVVNETDWNVVTDTGHDSLGGTGDPGDAFSSLSNVDVLAMAAGVGGLSGKVSDLYVTSPEVDTGDGAESLGHFPTSCFRGDGHVHNAVFAWWLPVNHGNEVQGDSVTFELGLYTEQCRHNPGDGPAFDTEE